MRSNPAMKKDIMNLAMLLLKMPIFIELYHEEIYDTTFTINHATISDEILMKYKYQFEVSSYLHDKTK